MCCVSRQPYGSKHISCTFISINIPKLYFSRVYLYKIHITILIDYAFCLWDFFSHIWYDILIFEFFWSSLELSQLLMTHINFHLLYWHICLYFRFPSDSVTKSEKEREKSIHKLDTAPTHTYSHSATTVRFCKHDEFYSVPF